MAKNDDCDEPPGSAERQVENFKEDLGPFVVAAETTRMPMLFTDAGMPDNPIIYANESLLDLFGYSKAQIIGKPFSFLLYSREHRAKFNLSAAARHGSKTTQCVQCVRRNGNEFKAAILVSEVRDKNKAIEQFFASIVELTEHQVALSQYQAKVNKLYQHAPGFIAMSRGPEHLFTFANSAFETLIGGRPLIGKSVAEALPEVVAQGFLEILDDVYRTGMRHSSGRTPIKLSRVRGADLETRYIEFVYEPVREESGDICGLFCEGIDVTDVERTAAELALAQAQVIQLSRCSAMGTMAATLAHEINQPLAAISNYAVGCLRILKDGDYDSPMLSEGLSGIAAASTRAGNIIQRLRDMTKKNTAQDENFPLGEALTEAVELVKAGGCEGVNFKIRLPNPGWVRGDRVQISQVIVNLLKNACEAQATHNSVGRIVGTVRKAGANVKLTVEDEGGGVSPTSRATLFEWTHSEKPGGMGLGLSVSKTIVENHGGTLHLDETGKAGSSFSVSLPGLIA